MRGPAMCSDFHISIVVKMLGQVSGLAVGTGQAKDEE